MAERRVLISFSVLEEYFQCSICLDLMKTTVMTSCGHRYCDKCIREWVDRYQTCPCCNRHLDTSQLIKDHQFDGLIEACKKEKITAECTCSEKPTSDPPETKEPSNELVQEQPSEPEVELPKICYAQQHREQGPSTVDYFTCNQCNFKWICRSCMQVCHKDHNVVPLVFNHTPTWACCYCPKKKTCQLQQAG